MNMDRGPALYKLYLLRFPTSFMLEFKMKFLFRTGTAAGWKEELRKLFPSKLIKNKDRGWLKLSEVY